MSSHIGLNMNSTNKVTHSIAIRAEVRRHESLQNTINKFLKQLERVEDKQLRTGLKVFLHSIQGEPVMNLFILSPKTLADRFPYRFARCDVDFRIFRGLRLTCMPFEFNSMLEPDSDSISYLDHPQKKTSLLIVHKLLV